MTVTTTTAAIFACALALSIFLSWYNGRNLIQCQRDLRQELEINEHNFRHFRHIEHALVYGIVTKANVTQLPEINYDKWAALVTLYDAPDLKAFRLPVTHTTDAALTTTFFWEVDDVKELEPYEIARLWLAGII